MYEGREVGMTFLMLASLETEVVQEGRGDGRTMLTSM